MSVAALDRLPAVVAVAGSVAALLYLLGARSDEATLADASRALARGDLPTAVERARAAGDGATIDGRAATVLAQASFGLGDLRGTIAALRRAVDARPNDWRLRRDLALALASAGDRRGARRQAERLLELNPRATLPSGFEVRVGGR